MTQKLSELSILSAELPGDHPIDGPEHNQSIGVLQRFNADRESNPVAKARRLRDFLSSEIPIYDQTNTKSLNSHPNPASDRIKYLGNLTEADLKEAGLYYHDPDNGGKAKPALLLPCGSYRTKSVCGN
ncbi:hypothetical protein [Salinisphaera sp.]|uniref:hypothetical protein n=1 Tax=Salinisphaera sp. TaxID=1914330 RepID=UPI002D782C45|nr:hypothetical protein [Salinisphaera sp.]HET7315206.1 hypothetical protein [Salinisphaera sp.]